MPILKCHMREDNMTDKEKQAHLAKLVGEAAAKLSEAEKFALEHGLTFDWSPAYGMGGYFDGKEKHNYLEQHWHPSSHSC